MIFFIAMLCSFYTIECVVQHALTANYHTICLDAYLLEMALPTHGRVILNTTAGEIDVELWSKVRTCVYETVFTLQMAQGNTKNMPELHSARTRRCVQQRASRAEADRLTFAGRLL